MAAASTDNPVLVLLHPGSSKCGTVAAASRRTDHRFVSRVSCDGCVVAFIAAQQAGRSFASAAMLVSALQLLQLSAPACRLAVVTQLAQHVRPGEVPWCHAGLWGLTRCARLERPAVHIHCIDLQRHQLAWLVAWARAPTGGAGMQWETAQRGAAPPYTPRLTAARSSAARQTDAGKDRAEYAAASVMGVRSGA